MFIIDSFPLKPAGEVVVTPLDSPPPSGVIVRSHDRCEYFGLATTYLEAVELQRAALAAGWQTAKIFDMTLSEITERPEDKKEPRPVVN